jgi:hypothetical protein
MDLKSFFTIFVKSINPMNYGDLVGERKRDASLYFFYLIFFAIILGGIFSIPKLGYLPQALNNSISKFTKFTVTGVEIETSEPLILLKNPEIVLDFRPEPETKDAFLLVTQEDIYLRKFSPNLFQLSMYNTTRTPMSNYSDVLQDFNRFKGTLWIFFIFMLPSMLFFIYVLNIVKYLFILALVMIFTIMVALIFRYKMHMQNMLKTAIFSISIMAFMDISLAPFFDFKIFSFLIFIIIYVLALRYAKKGERRPAKDEKKKEKEKKDENIGLETF